VAAIEEISLIEAARAGDPDAVDALLTRYEPRLLRFAARLCRDHEDAQDVLQESLLAAVRSLRDYRGDASLSTWLYTIARSFCIKKRRRSVYAPKAEVSLEWEARAADAVADPGRDPERQLENTELAQALDTAIAELEPEKREVLLLRDVEGLPAAEVAEILGLSVEAVKSRLHRARLAVRERLLPVLGRGVRPEGCPEIGALFSRHLEGEIGPDACAAMERHLLACPACKSECQTLRAILGACAAAPEPRVPVPLQESIRLGIRQLLSRRA
jgi:RNA polymerase sigma-70 factor (ECF subfamily)